MATYAILGSTGNCGTALIQNLIKNDKYKINAYCRSKAKLFGLMPGVEANPRVTIFQGGIDDVSLLSQCVKGCRAVFICVSTNDNIPGCCLSQDTVKTVLSALRDIKVGGGRLPKLVLLSSCTVDEYLSRKTPWILHQTLLRSASHVYNDLREAEKLLRAQEDWIKTIYIKPGALAVDKQRGHALSLTDEESPVSYLDLAAAMLEAADDPDDKYDSKNVSVVNTNGAASFPSGTPLCILVGLLRHFFPFLHPYLPMSTGPK